MWLLLTIMALVPPTVSPTNVSLISVSFISIFVPGVHDFILGWYHFPVCLMPERPLNAILLGTLVLFDIVCFSLSPLAPETVSYLFYGDVPAVGLYHDGDRCNTDAPLFDRPCLLFC
jgi:hypothetical protein